MVPVCTTSRSRGVMRSLTRRSPGTNRMSRSVSSPLQPLRGIDDGQRADTGLRISRLASETERVVADRVRIENDAVLRPLDREHFGDLRRDVACAESAVDDPDAAFLRQHHGHRRARDRVHVGRHDRPIERDVLREPARQVDRRRVAADDRRAAA